MKSAAAGNSYEAVFKLPVLDQKSRCFQRVASMRITNGNKIPFTGYV